MRERVKSVGVEGSEPWTKTIGQPPMADTPGPKGPVGPQRPADLAGAADAKFPEPSVGADVAKSTRVAQLDQCTVMQVELLATKKKLAEADERMGLWAVQDARRRKQELDKEESNLMSEVSRQLGAPAGSNIKLIDKERGLCQIE